MCLLSRGGAQSWGCWRGKGLGDSQGKKTKKHKGTGWGTAKWAPLQVPVVSQLPVHALIADVAWGEWRTKSGSGVEGGLFIMRFHLTFNPKPLRASSLPLLTLMVGTSPGVYLGLVRRYTRGDVLAAEPLSSGLFCPRRQAKQMIQPPREHFIWNHTASSI